VEVAEEAAPSAEALSAEAVPRQDGNFRLKIVN